jgi:hypothetical protein
MPRVMDFGYTPKIISVMIAGGKVVLVALLLVTEDLEKKIGNYLKPIEEPFVLFTILTIAVVVPVTYVWMREDGQILVL